MEISLRRLRPDSSQTHFDKTDHHHIVSISCYRSRHRQKLIIFPNITRNRNAGKKLESPNGKRDNKEQRANPRRVMKIVVKKILKNFKGTQLPISVRCSSSHKVSSVLDSAWAAHIEQGLAYLCNRLMCMFRDVTQVVNCVVRNDSIKLS